MKQKAKYRFRGDQKLHAEQLMHQQLFVMGRDIESKHGNLLLLYGCARQQSPMHSVPSFYSYEYSNHRRIAFRNFGVFMGDDGLGGIFVQRRDFEARLLRSSDLSNVPWLPRHLQPTRAPRSPADRFATACLMRLLVEWFLAYEEWIQCNYGRRFRAGQLVRFRMRNNEVWTWDMQGGWQTILDWLLLRHT